MHYTENKGVNVVLDMIGKNYFSKKFKTLCDKGKFISIAFLSGNKVQLDLALIFKKRILFFSNFKTKNCR